MERFYRLKNSAPFLSHAQRARNITRNKKTELLKSLAEFSKAISEEGLIFMGKSFGMVDIMLVPHTLRFFILTHYREFDIPDTMDYAKFRMWFDYVLRTCMFILFESKNKSFTSEIFHSQRAFGVKMTSYQRRCDVITSHRC